MLDGSMLEFQKLDKAALYATTLFGTVAMYMFSVRQGFNGAVDFLRRVLPGRQQVFYDRTDFVVVVFCGSIIGTIFYSPSSTIQALAAGFGWVGAINVLMHQKTEGVTEDRHKANMRETSVRPEEQPKGDAK